MAQNARQGFACRGLTAAEVAERVRLGQVNRTPRTVVREYAQIVARNLLTWFNAMVAPAAIALFALGEIQGGIAVSGMAIINTVLGLVQEIRAKHHLDQLALLVEAKARVVRDGAERTIPASAVVLGDCILLAAGETVVADGPVLEARFLEIDEALLTGESDPVRRVPGDPLLSGSYCVAGEGAYRADKVGPEAFANRTSAEARHYRYVASPLTQVINRLVQILTFTALGLIALYALAYVLAGFPGNDDRQRDFARMAAATITSMVPQGMVLTATMAFTLGALVMSRRGAVVQRLSAVETMAAIDVVCTDKTGTLTTNHLRVEQIVALGTGRDAPSEDEARRLIGVFAATSLDRGNRNIQALNLALGNAPAEAHAEAMDQLPFKSQNRYSGVRLMDNGKARLLVLGAVEALRDRLEEAIPHLEEMVPELQHQGLRLLLFTEGPADVRLAEITALPDSVRLRPLCLVCLGDELRPEAGEVLEKLSSQGIDCKVLSGDNPQTVQGTVRHLNLPWAQDPVVSGDDLRLAENRDELIIQHSVFGRVSPEQKLAIVELLKRRGKHVAMIGDGVNDVLPIKRADLGIAMGAGSQATKTVAGLVLENNQFALLPQTLEEGRTIVRNLRRSAKLFLVKNVYSFILILVYYTGWLGLPFPYVPQQVTLLNWSVIGIPAFVIALSRERSTSATKPRFLREVGGFALRTGVLFGVAGIAIMLIAGYLHGHDPQEERWRWQQTMLLSVMILLGITALFRTLTDGESGQVRGDQRYRLIGIAAIPAYLIALYWNPGDFFEVMPLGYVEWGWVILVAGVTYAATLAGDRLVSPGEDAASAKQ
ncbi:MAG: HAD-IC family P-type ATPase [Gemmataceae bacterium]|nr:HAD-IC family P-type ATPase [Gemmataceae bacterium]